jgi:hypothetical protein
MIVLCCFCSKSENRFPAPHWSECKQWTKECHSQHPHIQKSVKLMLLVNARLKSTGRVCLLPDLLPLVFTHLTRAETPRWIRYPWSNFSHRASFDGRIELCYTGIHRFESFDDE